MVVAKVVELLRTPTSLNADILLEWCLISIFHTTELLQELHSRQEREMCSHLKEVLDLPTVDILDESDELLSHKFQLVYAWGQQRRLSSLHQRVMMVQHVLQVLCNDDEVKAVASQSSGAQQSRPEEAISFCSHSGRFGPLPSIRLIPGACKFSSVDWLPLSFMCECDEPWSVHIPYCSRSSHTFI